VLLLLAVVSNWTTSDACLTNASVTFNSAFPRLNWAAVSVSAMLFGILLAVANTVGDVSNWTLLLTALAAPIGGVIIADYYVLRVRVGFSRTRAAPVNAAALLATAAGIAVSFVCERLAPSALTPLVSAPVAGFIYLLLASLAPHRLGADLGRATAGAEALD
jgi:cytosine permease